MNITQFTKKYSPELLTGLGIVGLVSTTIMAVRITPKAIRLIENKKKETHQDELKTIDTIKTAWKCYIPCAVTGITSIICIIGANSLNMKRKAAIAAAYTMTEAALTEYKDKVVKSIGEKKEGEIREAIVQDKIDRIPIESSQVIITGNGNTRCFDIFSGRYFESNIDKIKRSLNDLNEQLLNEGTVTLNDFYYNIDLDPIPIGDELGWNALKGQIKIDFSSHLSSDKVPCLAIQFSVEPKYEYYV